MIGSLDIPWQTGEKLFEEWSQTVDRLTRLGLRMKFDFPTAIHAQQIAWPADCPLTEPELRAEVEALLGEVRAIHNTIEALEQRARELYGRLPPQAAAELESDVPQSVYYALADAVSVVQEDGIEDDASSFLEDALAATPESLRAEWLHFLLRRNLGFLPESEKIVSGLVGVLLRGKENGGPDEPR